MIIARSLWRKAIVTAVAAGGFVSLYETTILDSKYAARLALPAVKERDTYYKVVFHVVGS